MVCLPKLLPSSSLDCNELSYGSEVLFGRPETYRLNCQVEYKEMSQIQTKPNQIRRVSGSEYCFSRQIEDKN